MKYVLMAMCVLFLSACTQQIGPFVSNVSRTKGDELSVEKCYVEHDIVTGKMYVRECSVQKI